MEELGGFRPDTKYLSVAGKLMIAGEYAVTQPGHTGIVMAIEDFMTFEIMPSSDFIIVSHLGQGEKVVYEHLMTDMADETKKGFLWEALRVFYDFMALDRSTSRRGAIACQEENKHEIIVRTNKDRIGMGYGSSSALVVGLIKSLWWIHYHQEMDHDLLFKLAYIAHYRGQGSGSGIDIAASVYGGILTYCTIDIKSLLRVGSLTDQIDHPIWQGLMIHPLEKFKWSIEVLYSGHKASTKDLLAIFETYKAREPEAYRIWLKQMENSTDSLAGAMRAGAYYKFISGIKEQRFLLTELGKGMGVRMETAAMKEMCDSFEKRGAGKQSGAGGGDFVIGFYQ